MCGPGSRAMQPLGRSILALALVLLWCGGQQAAQAQTLTQEECTPLGFTGEAACSDCDSMAEYVKDEELVADCRKCCVADEKSLRYQAARLEVCPYRLSGLPSVKDFTDKHALQFGTALKVVDKMGAYPRILLTGGGADGQHKLSVRVDNWSAKQLVEFLKQKLDAAALAAAAAAS